MRELKDLSHEELCKRLNSLDGPKNTQPPTEWQQERGMILTLLLLVISHATLAVIVLSNGPRTLPIGGFIAGLCCVPVILTVGGCPILYGKPPKRK